MYLFVHLTYLHRGSLSQTFPTGEGQVFLAVLKTIGHYYIFSGIFSSQVKENACIEIKISIELRNCLKIKCIAIGARFLVCLAVSRDSHGQKIARFSSPDLDPAKLSAIKASCLASAAVCPE